mmetsp:Transcript_27489/g.82510  ORF Transcript_27489/g.82510 Transcript_27489/m.82510 type:complete len:99 (-) Transcript_27489:84-380(-)
MEPLEACVERYGAAARAALKLLCLALSWTSPPKAGLPAVQRGRHRRHARVPRKGAGEVAVCPGFRGATRRESTPPRRQRAPPEEDDPKKEERGRPEYH